MRACVRAPLSAPHAQCALCGCLSLYSYITDSAAAATAYSCGHKSYNAAIAVTNQPAPKACGSFMEAAKAQGYRTGMLVDSLSLSLSLAPGLVECFDDCFVGSFASIE